LVPVSAPHHIPEDLMDLRKLKTLIDLVAESAWSQNPTLQNWK